MAQCRRLALSVIRPRRKTLGFETRQRDLTPVLRQPVETTTKSGHAIHTDERHFLLAANDTDDLVFAVSPRNRYGLREAALRTDNW
jgi:hypothetical protein